ncbi:ANM_HP_G0242910.mRNA.1.CDS.1 [Saccharomyces cerevisiae]|nr:ANM_HP_G0242910.mRNA.1.CDS.1 [Saccharomyces cerevisiae]CAI7002515.1 ANM_HP_G0242910.mRNA.1.CDS.1 [Saccharomyces cerevisiae]
MGIKKHSLWKNSLQSFASGRLDLMKGRYTELFSAFSQPKSSAIFKSELQGIPQRSEHPIRVLMASVILDSLTSVNHYIRGRYLLDVV